MVAGAGTVVGIIQPLSGIRAIQKSHNEAEALPHDQHFAVVCTSIDIGSSSRQRRE